MITAFPRVSRMRAIWSTWRVFGLNVRTAARLPAHFLAGCDLRRETLVASLEIGDRSAHGPSPLPPCAWRGVKAGSAPVARRPAGPIRTVTLESIRTGRGSDDRRTGGLTQQPRCPGECRRPVHGR